MKTNFDGAMFGESYQASLGVVIRNSEGQVMTALSKKIHKPHSAQSVELLGARRAVTFCIEMVFRAPFSKAILSWLSNRFGGRGW